MNKKIFCLSGFIFLCMTNNLFSQEDSLESILVPGYSYQVPDFSKRSAALNKLDLSQNVLNESIYPKINTSHKACNFSQDGRVLTISNTGQTNSTRQSLISIGTLCDDAVIDLDLLSQTHNTYTASGLLTLYKDEHDSMFFAQRDIDSYKKSLSFEVFKDGTSVCFEVLSKEGVAPPNTLRIHLTGTILNLLLVKEGQCTVLRSINVGTYFDLNDKTVRDSFLVCAGARLRGGESLSLTRFEQYRIGNTTAAGSKAIHSEQNKKSVKAPLNKAVLIPAVLAVLGVAGAAAFFLVTSFLKMNRKQTRHCKNKPIDRDF